MMGLICSQHTSLCIVKHITLHDGTDLLTARISLHSQTHYTAWWDWSAHNTHLSAQSNTLHSMMGLICSQHISLCTFKHYSIVWCDWSAQRTHLSAQSNTLHSMMGLICTQDTSICSQTHHIAWWDSSAHSTHLSAQSNILHSMMGLICSQHTFLYTVKHIT